MPTDLLGLPQRLRERWKELSPDSYNRLRRLYRKLRPLRQELPPYGSIVVVDGIKMRVDPRMSDYNIKKLMAGRHTIHERRLVLGVLEPDDIVMELGGGIGMVAIACAKRIGSERVFSYEANPRLESLIRDNYALNDVAPTLKMCMLGSGAGSHTFYLAKKFSRSSAYDSEEDSEAIEVPVEPFNDEVRRIAPSVLIVDIQGSEKEFVDYADLGTVKKLLIEVHPRIIGVVAAKAVRERVETMGFAMQAEGANSQLYLREEASSRAEPSL